MFLYSKEICSQPEAAISIQNAALSNFFGLLYKISTMECKVSYLGIGRTVVATYASSCVTGLKTMQS